MRGARGFGGIGDERPPQKRLFPPGREEPISGGTHISGGAHISSVVISRPHDVIRVHCMPRLGPIQEDMHPPRHKASFSRNFMQVRIGCLAPGHAVSAISIIAEP